MKPAILIVNEDALPNNCSGFYILRQPAIVDENVLPNTCSGS